MSLSQPLTRAARYRRERQLAELAIAEYGLSGAQLHLMKYSNTALFRVDAAERFVLRLHPPDRHPTAVLRTELVWLAILRQQTGLLVPEPIAAPDGRLLVECYLPELAEQRRAALFRWLPGRHKLRSLTPADAQRIGMCLGQLHGFAEQYVPPADFVRWRFDWGEFAAMTIEREPRPDLLSPQDRQLMHRAIAIVRAAMRELDDRPDAFGLIHADTNLSNFVFDGQQLGMLDFEVFCFGYYLFDVTRTLLEFEMFGDRAAQLAVAFRHGYRQFRELADLDHPHMLAFQIMNVVDLIVWILDWDERMPLATGPCRVVAALEQLRRLTKAESQYKV